MTKVINLAEKRQERQKAEEAERKTEAQNLIDQLRIDLRPATFVPHPVEDFEDDLDDDEEYASPENEAVFIRLMTEHQDRVVN